jgi:hypothetical protein
MTPNSRYRWCFHGAWNDSNFGDDLLKLAAHEVVRAAERMSDSKIFANFASPVFLGGPSCDPEAGSHIFWSGTQHFFHINRFSDFIRNIKIHYWVIPRMFRKNSDFGMYLVSSFERKIIFIASGFGPFSLPFLPIKRILNNYLGQNSYLTVRDTVSAKISGKDPRIVADPVASLVHEQLFNVKAVNQTHVLLSPRSWSGSRSNRKQSKIIFSFIEAAKELDIPYKFFFANRGDYLAWQNIAEGEEFLIWDSEDSQKAFEYLQTCSHAITSRWHVGMVCKYLGASVYFIEIEQKLRVLGQYFGEVLSRGSPKQARAILSCQDPIQTTRLGSIVTPIDELARILIENSSEFKV